uniref:GOLD domain-containing protein n=1 Tax=Parastrongyloides trichosuri TaxID=131310 RepID=A0A0N4ZWI9_PARTI
MYKIILFILLLVNTSLCRVILSSGCNEKPTTVSFRGSFTCNSKLYTPNKVSLVVRTEAGSKVETLNNNITPTSEGKYDVTTTFTGYSNFYLTIEVDHKCNILDYKKNIPYTFSIPIPDGHIYCNGHSKSPFDFGNKELNNGSHRPRMSHMGPFGK